MVAATDILRYDYDKIAWADLMLASVRMAALDRSRPRVSLEFSRLAARTVARQILGRYLGSASIGETQPRSVGFCGRAQRPCPAGHQSWRYLRACPTIRVLGSKIKSAYMMRLH